MQARQDPRFLIRLRSTHSADDNPSISGTVLDLSLHGCRITSTAPVCPGMVFKLHLEVPGCEEQILIARAEVRWVRGEQCGLSFFTYTMEAYDRLLDTIQRFRPETNEEALPM